VNCESRYRKFSEWQNRVHARPLHRQRRAPPIRAGRTRRTTNSATRKAVVGGTEVSVVTADLVQAAVRHLQTRKAQVLPVIPPVVAVVHRLPGESPENRTGSGQAPRNHARSRLTRNPSPARSTASGVNPRKIRKVIDLGNSLKWKLLKSPRGVRKVVSHPHKSRRAFLAPRTGRMARYPVFVSPYTHCNWMRFAVDLMPWRTEKLLLICWLRKTTSSTGCSCPMKRRPLA
jgi:hypothetical protein